MQAQEKLKLLKSLSLLANIPAKELKALAEFLQPIPFKDGSIIFEEGSKGECLYFISSGNVRILKKIHKTGSTSTFKELAALGPGDCFGEMTLFEQMPRSARATAAGKVLLFELGRKDLQAWLKSNPALAIGFFTELTQLLSKRLRRASSEMTLLYDLSSRLLEHVPDSKELAKKALEHIIPYLEGSWTAGAFLLNEFNDEMELAATAGDFTPAKFKIPADQKDTSIWIDDKNYLVILPGEKRMQGYMVFRAAQKLTTEEKNEIARTLTTAARLLASALENNAFRTEQALRSRLSTSRQYASGL